MLEKLGEEGRVTASVYERLMREYGKRLEVKSQKD